MRQPGFAARSYPLQGLLEMQNSPTKNREDPLKKAAKVAQAEGLDTAEARLAAFQNMDVRSQGGSCYNDFFGYDKNP